MRIQIFKYAVYSLVSSSCEALLTACRLVMSDWWVCHGNATLVQAYHWLCHLPRLVSGYKTALRRMVGWLGLGCLNPGSRTRWHHPGGWWFRVSGKMQIFRHNQYPPPPPPPSACHHFPLEPSHFRTQPWLFASSPEFWVHTEDDWWWC